jgi:hypothetical protein
MLSTSLFDAFTGLAVILACVVPAALFLCLPRSEGDTGREWTMQPGRRR